MDWWRKLTGRSKPTDPILGEHIGWTVLGNLPVKSGRVWVGDAAFAPNEADGEVVELAPGEYEGRVRWLRFGHDERAANLVLVPSGAAFTRGEQLGTTWADTATQGVCDFNLFQAAIVDEEEYREAYELQVEFKGSQRFAYGDAVLLVTSSGFGDGSFKLFELVHEGRRVGIEVEMIGPDEPYPFG